MLGNINNHFTEFDCPINTTLTDHCRCSDNEICSPSQICLNSSCVSPCPLYPLLPEPISSSCLCEDSICSPQQMCVQDDSGNSSRRRCVSRPNLCPMYPNTTPGVNCVCSHLSLICPAGLACDDTIIVKDPCNTNPCQNPTASAGIAGCFCDDNFQPPLYDRNCTLLPCPRMPSINQHDCICGDQNIICSSGTMCDTSKEPGQVCWNLCPPDEVLTGECFCTAAQKYCSVGFRCDTNHRKDRYSHLFQNLPSISFSTCTQTKCQAPYLWQNWDLLNMTEEEEDYGGDPTNKYLEGSHLALKCKEGSFLVQSEQVFHHLKFG